MKVNPQLLKRNERIRKRYAELISQAKKKGERLKSIDAFEIIGNEENLGIESIRQILYRPSPNELRERARAMSP